MAVRWRASVIPGVLALGALTMTACSSTGTIGAATGGAAGGPLPGPLGSSTGVPNTSAATGTSAPSSADTDSATTSSAPSSSAGTSSAAPSSPADPSALASSLKTLNGIWTDQGCKTALAGFGAYVSAQETSPAQGVAAIPAAVQQIRAGAQQTKVPAASQAMTKMVADMLAMYTAAQEGHTPDEGPVKTDFQIMGNACMPPP